MDAVKPNPAASNEVTADRDLVPPKVDPTTEALGKLIADTLADFDPDIPSERRLKVNSERPPLTLPRTWAKKAG